MPNVPKNFTGGIISETPVGPLTLIFSPLGLTRIQFESLSEDYEPAGTLFETAAQELAAYFAGELTRFSVPLAPCGTAFQKRVWALLPDIPYGETRSYGQLARLLGDSRLARAVGRANGSNPIPIIYPCHRVMGANGQLTGYSGGLHRKELLLHLEAGNTQADLFSHCEDTPRAS